MTDESHVRQNVLYILHFNLLSLIIQIKLFIFIIFGFWYIIFIIKKNTLYLIIMSKYVYPKYNTDSQVVDDYFGTKVTI